MKVLKFGGTSVGAPDRMRRVAEIIQREPGSMVVLSALSKTTDKLVEISQALIAQNKQQASEQIEALKAHYDHFVEKLFSTPGGRARGEELIATHFEYIRSFTLDMFTANEERAILAQGELISTALFHFYLQECAIPSILLPALDFIRLDERGEPDLEYIRENLKKLLAGHTGDQFYITQGYICRNRFGEIDNLKRGGSDYTASLVGAALECEEIQIWTDIDGMHNSDPRYVKNTRPISRLSFDEAAELAYFGAKILHPASVRPAQQYNIPVRLLNTMNPSAAGTLITANHLPGQVKAVAAKDGITAIKIKSSRMLLAYGFLRRIFEIFERYKTAIDMITTSEVAVSVTIDHDGHLQPIVKELSELGTVEIDRDQAIICVVGDFIAEETPIAVKVIAALKGVHLRMISFGGSRHNISILVPADHRARALQALHRELFHV